MVLALQVLPQLVVVLLVLVSRVVQVAAMEAVVPLAEVVPNVQVAAKVILELMQVPRLRLRHMPEAIRNKVKVPTKKQKQQQYSQVYT